MIIKMQSRYSSDSFVMETSDYSTRYEFYQTPEEQVEILEWIAEYSCPFGLDDEGENKVVTPSSLLVLTSEEKTFVVKHADVYVMNDNGKTIDHLVAD